MIYIVLKTILKHNYQKYNTIDFVLLCRMCNDHLQDFLSDGLLRIIHTKLIFGGFLFGYKKGLGPILGLLKSILYSFYTKNGIF